MTQLTEIRTENIDPDAMKVVRRLLRFDHEAYLVGGCVRDLLLGRTPKDFDIATSATPAEIKKTFRNCRIIGRRFQLAHIFFGRKIIETSTFRAPPPQEADDNGETQIIRRDNIFGTAEEDARRRDFTINGLFHDIRKNEVIDHVGGLEDLRKRRMRTIGDPRIRIPEDPVRVLRAMKFAARLGFTIDDDTLAAIVEFRGMISQCAMARVLEEIYRLLGGGYSVPAFRLMHRTGVLAVLFPEIQAMLAPPDDPRARSRVPAIQSPNRAVSERKETPAQAPAQAPPPGPDELSAEQAAMLASVDQLVEQLMGDDPRHRDEAARLMWCHLKALDRTASTSETPLSHATILGFALLGLASRQMTNDEPLNKSMSHLEQLVKAVSTRLCISRKDRERLKQIICAQRRMIHRSKRGRPASLVRREYFPEAWLLFEATVQDRGEHEDDLERWRQVMANAGPGKRGRRRRGRRRRRPRPQE